MKSERKPNTFLRNQKEKSEKERKKRNWRKHRTWTRRKNRKESVFLLILRKSNILLRRRFVWNHSIPEKVTANSISFEFFFSSPVCFEISRFMHIQSERKEALGKRVRSIFTSRRCSFLPSNWSKLFWEKALEMMILRTEVDNFMTTRSNHFHQVICNCSPNCVN